MTIAGKRRLLYVAPMVALVQSTLAAEVAYPVRPIRIIVPKSPGASTDLTARMMGQRLSEAFKQPVVIDNRPGSSGIAGTETVARAIAASSALSIAGGGDTLAAIAKYGLNAVALLGDYTGFSKDITQELNRYGRAGVPLVLVFPKNPGAKAIVLPEAITPGMVVKALEQAAGDIYYWRGPFEKAIEHYQHALAHTAAANQRAAIRTKIGATYAYVGDKRGLPFLIGGEECFCSRETGPAATPINFGALDRKAIVDAGVSLQYAERPSLVAEHGFTTGFIPYVSFEKPGPATRMKVGRVADMGCAPEGLPAEKRGLTAS